MLFSLFFDPQSNTQQTKSTQNTGAFTGALQLKRRYIIYIYQVFNTIIRLTPPPPYTNKKATPKGVAILFVFGAA